MFGGWGHSDFDRIDLLRYFLRVGLFHLTASGSAHSCCLVGRVMRVQPSGAPDVLRASRVQVFEICGIWGGLIAQATRAQAGMRDLLRWSKPSLPGEGRCRTCRLTG